MRKMLLHFNERHITKTMANENDTDSFLSMSNLSFIMPTYFDFDLNFFIKFINVVYR